jgi:hypothetical protein|tara:strand:+ start:1600 stop:1917 length:318 start_codon:yes stop_codon:yes gene_type:complete
MDTLDNTQEDLDNIEGSLDNADEDKKKALYVFYGVVTLIIFLIIISLVWSFFISKNSSGDMNIPGQDSIRASDVPPLIEEETPEPSNISQLIEEETPEPSDVPPL